MANESPETLELVVLTQDQEADVEQTIRGLHRLLSKRLARPWTITIADRSSSDSTPIIAALLAKDLDRVGCRSLPGNLEDKALRREWANSSADVVAFARLGGETDLDTLLAPLEDHLDRSAPSRPRISRRSALASVGGIGLGAVLAACGASTSSKTGSSSSTATGASDSTSAPGTTTPSTTAASTGTSAVTTASSVVLAPEMTEGPYYLDLNLVRSNVVEDRTGAPLALSLVVADASSGQPVKGAAVDIWHTDANGIYSGFVAASTAANGGGGGGGATDNSTFLRGTQLSDSSGKVTFATVYPGWYRGRTVHIHVKVHVSGKVIHVGQLFFDDSFTDTVYAATAPYSARSARDTRNTNDSIYSGGGAQSVLAVQKSGATYSATMTMGVATS